MEKSKTDAADSKERPIEAEVRLDEPEVQPEPEESKHLTGGPQWPPATPERKPLR